MRLYPGKVDTIAAEIITSLTQAGDIEVSDGNEAQLDAAAVLKEYIRVDKELTERAKDILEIRGLPYSHLGRTKRQLAEQKEFGLGEEGRPNTSMKCLPTMRSCAARSRRSARST
jgi:hypothetical protein